VRVAASPAPGRTGKLLPVGNLHFSEAFDDPVALLQATEANRLEGIVSKRADMLYRSGRRPEWIKVKTVVWRDANQDRYEKLTGG
jgi:ATP-dependent DNA ligase